MATGKIKIDVTYSGNSTKPVETDQITLPGTLEASANATEATARYSGQDDSGNPATITKRAVPPANETFRSATIRATLTCDPPKTATPVTLTGNVSVSGRVEGDCIIITAVSKSGDAVGDVETIVETRLQTCCREPAKKVSFDDSKLLEGVAGLLDKRFADFREDMADAVDRRLADLLEPDSSEIEDAGPGVWLGLGFKEEGGLTVTGALPGSPAQVGKFVKGDQLRGLNGEAVESLDQLIALLGKLSVFDGLTASVLRGDEEVDLKLTGSPRLLPNGDMISSFAMNRACGDDCECSKTERRSICGKAWRYLGEHESGALAYEEQCITINPRQTPSKTMHVCGVALFV